MLARSCNVDRRPVEWRTVEAGLISALFERERGLLDILRDDHFDPTFSPHPSPAVRLRPNVEDDCRREQLRWLFRSNPPVCVNSP